MIGISSGGEWGGCAWCVRVCVCFRKICQCRAKVFSSFVCLLLGFGSSQSLLYGLAHCEFPREEYSVQSFPNYFDQGTLCNKTYLWDLGSKEHF